MIFLLLSILCSTALGLIFRAFPKYGVHNLQAIVINYFVCVLCSGLLTGEFPIKADVVETTYFPFALGLGCLFITGFNLVALATQKLGITIAAILQKMSMVLSVTAAFILYQETMTVFKITGIVLAIAAIILCNWPHKNRTQEFKSNILIALATWLMASSIEIFLQYCELRVLETSGDPEFLALLFGTAGVIGSFLVLGGFITGKWYFSIRNIQAGLILGIINYGSIYFLMRALGMGWEGSVVFPLNNLGIILFSALIAYFFLKEHLTKINLIGVGLSLMAILTIMMG